MTDLATRRNEIESELAGLRRQRGAAVLAGRKFDGAKITSLESELFALAEAESEQAQRDREAAASKLEAERANARMKLAKLEDERLRALQDANAHARGLAEAIEIALDRQGQMTKVAQIITEGRIPRALHIPDFVSRIAGRLAAVMRSIPNYPARLGHLTWTGPDFFKASDYWRNREAIMLEPFLTPLLGKEKANGKSETGD